MSPDHRGTDVEAIGRLYRREKRAFWWTFGWLGILSVVWTGASVFDFLVQRRVAELLAIADGDYLPDLEAYYIQVRPWRLGSRILVLFLATGFGVCLVRWLLAIRRRRNHPPA